MYEQPRPRPAPRRRPCPITVAPRRGVDPLGRAYKQHSLADGLLAGGLAALDDGDYRHAEMFLTTALQVRVEYLDHQTVADNLTMLAEIAVALGDRRRAARLLGAATGFAVQTGYTIEPFFRARHERTARDVRADLGDSEFDAAWDAGRSSPDDIISEASAAATDDFQVLIDYLSVGEPARRAG